MDATDNPFDRLARLRGRRTQRDVAVACGVDRTTYSRIERGAARPSWALWRRLRLELGVGVDLADAVEAAWAAGAGHWRRSQAELDASD